VGVLNVREVLVRSVPVLTLLVLIEMIGGSALGKAYADIKPIFFVLVPPFIGKGGNIGSVFASRISTALHLGVLRPSIRGNGILKSNVIALVFSGLVSFAFLGVFVYFVSLILNVPRIAFPRFLAITLLSGTCLTFFAIGLSLLACFASYNRGIDPDDYVVPIVTTTSDLVGILFLLTFIVLLGT